MRRALLASVCACAFGLGGCANFANNVHQFSTGYQSVVADINADIAATAPDVAVACANLQTAGMLVAPFVPANTKAQATLAAVNTGIVADPRNLGARPGGDPASANLNFANRRFATVVPQQTFAAAQPIARAKGRIAPAAKPGFKRS